MNAIKHPLSTRHWSYLDNPKFASLKTEVVPNQFFVFINIIRKLDFKIFNNFFDLNDFDRAFYYFIVFIRYHIVGIYYYLKKIGDNPFLASLFLEQTTALSVNNFRLILKYFTNSSCCYYSAVGSKIHWGRLGHEPADASVVESTDVSFFFVFEVPRFKCPVSFVVFTYISDTYFNIHVPIHNHLKIIIL